LTVANPDWLKNIGWISEGVFLFHPFLGREALLVFDISLDYFFLLVMLI